MTKSWAVAPSIGLLHVLEDLPVVLQGRALYEGRRAEVLKLAHEFFSRTVEGRRMRGAKAPLIRPSTERSLNASRFYGEFAEFAKTSLEWPLVPEEKDIVTYLRHFKQKGKLDSSTRTNFMQFFLEFAKWVGQRYNTLSGQERVARI